MSATQDKSQKTTFVYSNLYQLYRKGKEAAQRADADANPSFHVLKTADLKLQSKADPSSQVKIEEFKPTEFIGKRIESAASLTSLSSVAARVLGPEVAKAPPVQVQHQNAALSSLKQNVQALQDLHSRLRFMLKELQELAQDET